MRVKGFGVAGFLVLLSFRAGGVGAAGVDLRLVEAVKNQNQELVRALLAQRVDVNVASADGATALHWAVHWSDASTADLLIRAGANVNEANGFAVTPLSLACSNGDAAIVEMLLKAGANANAAIATGETPLMTCARAGSVQGVTALLAHGADVNAKEPSQSQTALMWAAAEQHADVMKVLLQYGGDFRATSQSRYTPLHFAARVGDVKGASLLLSAGADVSATAADGSTPLLVATVKGQVPLALFLLDHGADPNASGAGYTALHWASGSFETQVCNPVFGMKDPMCGIPDRAAKLTLVKALLAHGANPNARATEAPPRFGFNHYQQNVAGATPFFLAAGDADIELMKILLEAGADPNLPTKDNTTPLLAAAGLNLSQGERVVTERAALDAVRMLLGLGGTAKAPNAGGENGLHGAAYLGWNAMIHLLVDNGADVNTVSMRGLTPLLIAEGHGDREVSNTVVYHKDTAELFRSMGANPALGVPCEVQGCGLR